MKFCKKCKSLLLPKKDPKKGLVLVCGSCGLIDAKSEVQSVITTKVQKTDTISIIDSSVEDATLPTTQAKCPKCEHDIAYYWIQQTRASDEPETKFLKCVACKHIWREYQ